MAPRAIVRLRGRVPAWLHRAIGLLGAALILLAYYLAAEGLVPATTALSNAINLTGALAVLFSLVFEWNWAAILLELAWALIALKGLLAHSLSLLPGAGP